MRRHSHRTIALLLIAVLAGEWATPALAQQAASTNFMSNSSINTFGGSATSTNFSSLQTGGQTGSGESNSTSYTLDSGFLYFDTFTPESSTWRWYDDANDETPTSPMAAENAAPSGVGSGAIKLRVVVPEAANIGLKGAKFRLQYATASDFSSGTHELGAAAACNASFAWCYATSTGGTDDAVLTTALLTGADACTGGVGTGCGTHNTSGTASSTFTHVKGASVEYEFTVQKGAAASNTVYFFRLVDVAASSTVPLSTGASYPSLSTGGGSLSFSIGGLPSASVVSGINTNVDTTSTDVAFGALPIGTPTAAAQQLAVSTNAAQGYAIYAYEQQALLGDGGSQIPPVSGTNLSPASWSSGCSSSASGCYGYHTDASVLSGTSTQVQTRFAANDTFAQFTGAPAEVAYSAAPVSSATTSVLYRLQANNAQPADSYSTSIIYIVVPVF